MARTEKSKVIGKWFDGQTMSKGLVVVFVLMAIAISQCYAAGILRPTNGNSSDVFLKSHKVNVTINNGFARTEVDQVFGNKGSRDLEAVYSFPIPEDASLSELSLWIDGKEVIGEVLEKKRARQVYREETSQRIDPALAEKNGHKTFDITVFPVVRNGDTRMRFVYYQPIKIDSNVGRYVYPLAGGGSDDDASQFWAIDEKVDEEFSFDLLLKSAFPVDDVRVAGFADASIQKDGVEVGDIYKVSLDSSAVKSIDRDIVVYYKLADDVPARIELIPYRQDKSSKGTFMAVVTPAADLKRISEGNDWTFVLDTSGSMRGGKLMTLIEAVTASIEKMTPEDRFRVVAFSNSARDVTKGYVQATPENVAQAMEKIQAIKAGGGTDLYQGLLMAYKELDKERTTGLIIVSDAITDIEGGQYSKFLRLMEEYDVRLFCFVVGNGGDRGLMERLGKDSGGFAMTISDSDDVTGRLLQAKSHMLYENMHNVQLNIRGVKVDELTPEVIGNLYRGQQLVVLGRYDKSGEVELELKAKISGQDRSWKCKAVLPEVDTDNPELERLWALSKIEDVMEVIRDEGETEALRKEVIKLGTEFSLVTDYTSMLVITEESFKRRNIERKNERRVQNERKAQQQRASGPVKNYRVDQNKQNPSGNRGAFDGRRSPGFGSGPVGPLFLAGVYWICRRKRNSK